MTSAVQPIVNYLEVGFLNFGSCVHYWEQCPSLHTSHFLNMILLIFQMNIIVSKPNGCYVINIAHKKDMYSLVGTWFNV